MPPKKQSIGNQLKYWAVGRANKIKWAVGIIAGIAGCITAISTAWPHIEPVLVAHRGYVRDYVAETEKQFKTTEETTLKVLRDLQIETAEGKRDAAATAIDKFRLDLTKAQTDDEKLAISKTLRDLQNTQDKLNSQIRTLNHMRGD